MSQLPRQDQAPRGASPRWVHNYFGEGYRSVYRHVIDDEGELRRQARWIQRTLAWNPDDRLLDLACGYGRYLRFLRERPGCLFGLDLLRPMLQLAARDAAGVPLVEGDMLRLPLKSESLAFVLLLFNSFGYRPEDQIAGDAPERTLLSEVARVLRPRGRALLELPNREHIVLAVRENPRIVLSRDDRRLVEDWEISADETVLRGTSTFMRDGQVEQHRFALRLFGLTEMVAMAEAAGLRAAAIFGDLTGGAFRGADSEQTVLLLERR